MFVRHSPDLGTVVAPLSFLGMRIGTRMTVVRLPSGALVLHSPTPLAASREVVTAEGPVAHIVCPNLYHHLYAGEWAAAFPDAVVHAPKKLRGKRGDLRVDRDLEDATSATFEGALEPVAIAGSMMHETVFVHPASRTLVSADLTEYFTSSDHLPTRLYLKAAGVWGKPTWNRFLRFLYRDKRAARRSIDALLEHDFDRVTIGHGDVIEAGGREAIRSSFTFLG